jgi:hypothetical protein
VTKRKIVLKRHNGKVVACTTDIAAFCDNARHWHFMTACGKAITEAADPGFGEENFILGTYRGRNQQDNLCYFVTREGLDAMSKYLRGMAGHLAHIHRAFDACEKKLEAKGMLAAAIGAVTPAVFLHKTSGRWTVASRELAALTAHEHGNIMSAVRLAVKELEERGASGEVFWTMYFCRRTGRYFPCCHITREVMVQLRLHNVQGCRTVRDVVAEYIRLLDEKEAERLEPAKTEIPEEAAEPAPDAESLLAEVRAAGADVKIDGSKLLVRVPKGALTAAQRDLLAEHTKEIAALVAAEPAPDSEIRPPDPEPADTLEPFRPESWEINYAIKVLERSDMPEHLVRVNQAWNEKRKEALLAEAKSWIEAEDLYATEKPKREKAR